MNRNCWTMALGFGAVVTLSTACGSDGSLANSGSSDWVFDGGGRSGTTTGSSGATANAGGTSGNTGPVSNPGSSAGANGGGGKTSTSPGSGSSAGTSSSSGSSSVPVAGTGGKTMTGGGSGYHQLANWTEPMANNPNHHGRIYFLGNAHKDENGVECNSCHGKNYEGDSGPACSTCHEQWRSSCTFCHGTAGMMGAAPPRGVWDETATASLAVGRHAAHLNASKSHAAFACDTCHVVPQADDLDHTLQYQASKDLSAPGHHGDVVLANALPGMMWNVAATSGTPATMRGTCTGGCHSDGRGGAPVKTAYWAGSDAFTNSCGSCHSARPNSGHHGHALGEGATCADCHAGSTTDSYSVASHLNGKADYLGQVQGQGMTLKADSSCGSGVRCNGTCHGEDEDHNNKCW